MNKYKKALNEIVNELPYTSGIIQKNLTTLNELVKKETPIKPIVEDARNSGYSYGYSYICPKCNEVYVNVIHKYCNNCGQKLDWSDTNEIN